MYENFAVLADELENVCICGDPNYPNGYQDSGYCSSECATRAHFERCPTREAPLTEEELEVGRYPYTGEIEEPARPKKELTEEQIEAREAAVASRRSKEMQFAERLAAMRTVRNACVICGQKAKLRCRCLAAVCANCMDSYGACPTCADLESQPEIEPEYEISFSFASRIKADGPPVARASVELLRRGTLLF